MMALKPVIASNGGPFPQNEIGRIAQHVKKGEGRTEGNYRDVLKIMLLVTRQPSTDWLMIHF